MLCSAIGIFAFFGLADIALSTNVKLLPGNVATTRSQLSRSIAYILNDYTESSPVINLFKQARNPHNFDDLMDGILKDLKIVSTLFDAYPKLTGTNEKLLTLTLVDSSESFLVLCESIRSLNVNIHGRFVIVLKYEEEDYFKNIEEIMAESWAIDILHVNLIHQYNNSIKMYTYYPFEGECENTQPVVVNEYVNEAWTEKNFFPDKVSNLNKCPLDCATWVDPPYLNMYYYPDGTTRAIHGLEGRLIHFIANRMNFTLRFRWMNEKEINQTINPKPEFFKQFFSTGVEFMVGGFRFQHTSDLNAFSQTDIYFFSPIRLVIKAEEEKISGVQKFTFPFSSFVWIAIGMLNMCGVVVICVSLHLSKEKRKFILGSQTTRPFYNSWVSIFGGVVEHEPTRNFARFALILWILVWFVLRNGYQSQLYHFIRLAIAKNPPNTIIALLDQHYKFLVTPMLFDSLGYLPRMQASSVFINETELDHFKALLASTEHLAIVTPFEYFGYYRLKHFNANVQFHIIEETLFTQHRTIFVKKNSVFRYHFNSAILTYFSLGLMDKWQTDYLESHSVRKVSANHPKQMTIDDVGGIFTFYIFCNCGAVVVFLCEILRKKLCDRLAH